MSEKLTTNGFYIHKGQGFSGIFGKDIPTPVGRVAFVSLTTPTGNPTPKYGVALLIDKNDEVAKKELEALKVMGKNMAIDFWGDKYVEMLKRTKRKMLADGDEPSSTGKIYEGYPGNWVINARNAFSVDTSKGFKIYNKGMLPEQFESGMLCRLVVNPYLNADGFSYKLRAIKLVKDDGVRYGGAPDANTLLDDLDDAVGAVNAPQGELDSVI